MWKEIQHWKLAVLFGNAVLEYEWPRCSTVEMRRLSISSSPIIVWARNLFSCILQATSSKPLWYQAIFTVGINHCQLSSSKFNMPILCAQSLRLPSSKFKKPILCNHCACRPKFKGPIVSTQSLRLPSSKSNTLHSITAHAVLQV